MFLHLSPRLLSGIKKTCRHILSSGLLGCTNIHGIKAALTGDDNAEQGSEEVKDKDADVPPPVGTTFSIGRKSIQLLAYKHRRAKLVAVAGSNDDSLFEKLDENKFELGEYEHAKGLGQELTWQETKMTLWLKSLQPYCSSQTIRDRYSWPNGNNQLFVAAYGRQPSSEDQELINRVNNANTDSTQKAEILCLTVLSSLEFLTL